MMKEKGVNKEIKTSMSHHLKTTTTTTTTSPASSSFSFTNTPVTRPSKVPVTTTMMLILALLPNEITSVTISGLWSPSSSSLKVVARFGFVKADLYNRDRTDGYIFGNITSNPELPTVTLLNGTIKHQHQQQQPTYVNSSENKLRKVQSKAVILLVERTSLIRILGADVDPQRLNLIKSGQFTGKINCSLVFSIIEKIASDDTCRKDNNTNNITSNIINNNTITSSSNSNSLGNNDLIRYLPCPIGTICPGGSNIQRANSQITRSQFTYVIKDQKQPM